MTDLLREEKYKLKDSVNEFVRDTPESLEDKNYCIEGDGSGIMGVRANWKQLSRDHNSYKERMEVKL